MAKVSIVGGTTSYIANVFIQDSTVSTGAGKTGLAWNTANLVASYVRPGAARQAITLATQTPTGAYSSGGFVEIDATNMPGVYRLDIPDAAIAAGAKSVLIMLKGATGMAPCVLEVDLWAINPQDAVRGGMTALPNANAEAAGGLYTRGSGAGQINQPANGQIDVNTVKVGGTSQTAGDIPGKTNSLTFTGANKVDASVRDWVGDTIPARNVAGTPVVDVVDWKGAAPNALQAGRVDSYLGAIAAGVIAAASFAANALGAVWDELRSGHVTAGTFGQGNQTIDNGTAQGGAAGSITLRAGASAADSYYNGCLVVIVGGTGATQVRPITAYVGATKVATVSPNWASTPDNTSVYVVIGL